jgi:hypothetical protein
MTSAETWFCLPGQMTRGRITLTERRQDYSELLRDGLPVRIRAVHICFPAIKSVSCSFPLNYGFWEGNVEANVDTFWLCG